MAIAAEQSASGTAGAPPRSLWWLSGAILLGLAATWGAGSLAARTADAALAREAAVSASLFETVLRSALEKYRALPVVLASDGAIAAALADPDPATSHDLDARLARLATRTGAAAIYVIGADGRTIAASNAETPLSFVGREFRFRDYFAAAMQRGSGEQFALGTTTRRPGLYLSARVDRGGKALGVVVTKIDFSAVETKWRASAAPAFVTDANGVVLITSIEPWRFRPASSLPMQPRDGNVPMVMASLPGGKPAEFVLAKAETTTPGWTLNLLQPRADAVGAAVTAARALTLLAASALVLLLWALLRRRGLAAAAAAARAASQAELEARVEARTRELSDTNSQLTSEIEERRRAEAALLLLHLELEQANRLTTLGQIAAGVTHEINQPVTAIATWAHNAGVLLARGDTASAQGALTTISGLTERIGRITGELRDFARKSDGALAPVLVDDAIEGALLLVSARQHQAGASISRAPLQPGLSVIADRVRLEQVLVNLLQNALEAMESERVGASITIAASSCGGQIHISITDSGPGISPGIATSLFTPFQTSKPRGLGLGLVISRDICRALGGDLVLHPSPAGQRGASFAIKLPAAA